HKARVVEFREGWRGGSGDYSRVMKFFGGGGVRDRVRTRWWNLRGCCGVLGGWVFGEGKGDGYRGECIIRSLWNMGSAGGWREVSEVSAHFFAHRVEVAGDVSVIGQGFNDSGFGSEDLRGNGGGGMGELGFVPRGMGL